MKRPDLPPEEISKCTPTFQFPKSLLQPLIRSVVQLQDMGWLPSTPLQQHLVICGFPRSGTTLCQLMIESCVTGIKVFGRERRGLEVAQFSRRTHACVMTKRPKDLFLLSELRDFYESRCKDVRFIVMNRDPRSVLTSVHVSQPGNYWVSVSRWRHCFLHWKWACQFPDVLPIRYEDLVTRPNDVESQIKDFTGWTTSQPFQSFHEEIPRSFDVRALNGLRELDADNRNRWRQECHRARIQALLSELPELPDVLIELGYEKDDSWTCEYTGIRRSLPAAA